jgi:uncharacterized protein (TIGR03437 family)
MVVVTVAGQSSAPQAVPLGPSSPGIFSTNQQGTGQGAVQISNTTIYAAAAGSISGSQSRAVKPGEFITIYCTGLSAVSNPPAPGKPASSNPLSTTLTTPKVTIGGQPATVSFSGLSPGFVGLYQVNAQIPADAAGGKAVAVEMSIGGVESNTVTIAVNAPAGPSGNKITAGQSHTCVVTNAGAVLCWGLNDHGELGNGTNTSSSTPVPVSGLTSGVVAITAGQAFNCALTKTGTVMCWGQNEAGQLGNNTTNDSNVPVEVLAVNGSGPLSSIVAIGAGQVHMCAVTNAGALLCWGDDAENELGLGPQNLATFTTPQAVTTLSSSVATVSGGSYFTCVTTTDGAVWCMGLDGLGDGGNLPMKVSDTTGNAPLSGVAAVSTGKDDACVVTNSGTALCWGTNVYGELGNGTQVRSTIPVQVLDVTGKSPIAGVTATTSGEDDTCALTSAGAVLCWGYNNFDEVGSPNAAALLAIPQQVPGLTSGAIAIASGYDHNCAVTSTGEVMCWGLNLNGQLGNGSNRASFMPVAVLGVGGTGLLKLF